MPTDEAFAAVDAIFERFFTEKGAPGVAFGIVEDGRFVRIGAHGVARLTDGAPPTADTQFRIASMTKSFTASAILRLRDEGRLGLDDAVATHVPELAGWREKTATWRLIGGGGHGRRLRLELAVESPDGPLTKVAIRPETLEPPAEQD